MTHLEGTFKGIREADIYYQAWIPEGVTRSVLVVVHGLAEHCGRYGNLVNYFVPRGYAVWGVDHPGHGKSAGRRVYVDRFNDYTETLQRFFDLVRSHHPRQSLFLVGHSLGGLIASSYLLDHQAGLTGAVLSGPVVKIPENISPGVIFLGKILSAFVPTMRLVGLQAQGICRDPAVVQAYLDDPLVFKGKTTARLGAEMLKAMERVSSQAVKIVLPVLIVQGSADLLVNPDGARMLYEKIGSRDKKILVYEGFFHEVFNEPEHLKVMGDLEEWLEGHQASGGK
jgi:alpha-beta hydrolase superfamily lysophospholipase